MKTQANKIKLQSSVANFRIQFKNEEDCAIKLAIELNSIAKEVSNIVAYAWTKQPVVSSKSFKLPIERVIAFRPGCIPSQQTLDAVTVAESNLSSFFAEALPKELRQALEPLKMVREKPLDESNVKWIKWTDPLHLLADLSQNAKLHPNYQATVSYVIEQIDTVLSVSDVCWKRLKMHWQSNILPKLEQSIQDDDGIDLKPTDAIIGRLDKWLESQSSELISQAMAGIDWKSQIMKRIAPSIKELVEEILKTEDLVDSRVSENLASKGGDVLWYKSDKFSFSIKDTFVAIVFLVVLNSLGLAYILRRGEENIDQADLTNKLQNIFDARYFKQQELQELKSSLNAEIDKAKFLSSTLKQELDKAKEANKEAGKAKEDFEKSKVKVQELLLKNSNAP